MPEEMTPTPSVETPATGQELPPAAPAIDPAIPPAPDAPELPAEAQQPTETYGMPDEDVLESEGEGGVPFGPALVVIVVVVLAALVVLGLRRKNGSGGSAAGSQQPNGGSRGGGTNGDVVEIYVGNLSYDMSEAQFRKEFERFGVVKSARIIGHRTSGKSKGYGFVEMPHRKEAMVAIKALHNRDVLGRKLRVNEARKGTRKD